MSSNSFQLNPLAGLSLKADHTTACDRTQPYSLNNHIERLYRLHTVSVVQGINYIR